jgi:hypothetical protein
VIAELIVADHRKARDLFAVAGNADQQAGGERAAAVAELGALWASHAAMLEAAVFPCLAGLRDGGAAVAAARTAREEVATRLAALAAEGDGARWLSAFERLKAAAEAQAAAEEVGIVAIIQSRLPPADIAALTRAARAARADSAAG